MPKALHSTRASSCSHASAVRRSGGGAGGGGAPSASPGCGRALWTADPLVRDRTRPPRTMWTKTTGNVLREECFGKSLVFGFEENDEEKKDSQFEGK